MGKKEKVYVAMSGGVDSSVAAALLLNQGYDCAGMYMITHEGGKKDSADAQAVADKLGIELEILDLREEFNQVIEYFCDEYSCARTPNPCVFCNREIKFGLLWKHAKAKGADYIATGHYIRSLQRDGNACLYAASNLAKDQSYVLSMIDQDVIDHILLPIGEYSKDKIREIAAEKKLGVESKPDSQEICFIPDDDYVARLELERPELAKEGNIVFSEGKILGTHNGLHNFTIGQRRGLGVAVGFPIYVVRLDLKTNTVVLGEKKDLMHTTLHASCANWLGEKPESPFEAKVKIRYNHSGAKAIVKPVGDGVVITFDEEISAITPGQVAVFYVEETDGLRLSGGAWIDGAGEIE